MTAPKTSSTPGGAVCRERDGESERDGEKERESRRVRVGVRETERDSEREGE